MMFALMTHHSTRSAGYSSSPYYAALGGIVALIHVKHSKAAGEDRESRRLCLVAPETRAPTGTGEIEYHSNIVHRGLGPAQIAASIVTKDGRPKYPGLHSLRHFYAS